MKSRNSRTVHNRLASQFLSRLLDQRKWNELQLSEVSGIRPSVISAHFSRKRPIRPQHLAAYLRVLNRHERSVLLEAWLQDNANPDAIANLLDGNTDLVLSAEENRRRMLECWAAAIAYDFRLAKIFCRFGTKTSFKVALDVLSLASCVAVQFQGWLLEKACSMLIRLKHGTVALVTLVLALCQQGKVTEEAGELAEHGDLAQKAIASSFFATSFVAPALVNTTNFHFDVGDSSSSASSQKGKAVSGERLQTEHRVAPAARIQRAINHEWLRLVRAPRSVNSAFSRVVRVAHLRQFKQTHRTPERN